MSSLIHARVAKDTEVIKRAVSASQCLIAMY